MDPSSSNGYDISEIPEDALGYYYSDFDEDGEDELLVLDQTGERFVRLNMYEVEDQTVVQADSVLAECDAYNDGSVKEFTVSEGVPAFAEDHYLRTRIVMFVGVVGSSYTLLQAFNHRTCAVNDRITVLLSYPIGRGRFAVRPQQYSRVVNGTQVIVVDGLQP